jgi:hypothetical protein
MLKSSVANGMSASLFLAASVLCPFAVPVDLLWWTLVA